MGHDVGEIVSGKVLLSSLSCKEKVEYLKKHFVPGEKFPLCTQKIGHCQKFRMLITYS